MSQMLVRIDKDADDALTYIYNKGGTVSLSEVGIVFAIMGGIFQQWKSNHEATLKLREKARKNVAQK